MKLGCHVVLFKQRIASETDVILNGVAGTGFAGFEVGSRFFGTERKQELQDKLNQYNLEVSAMHVGAPLQAWVEKEDENRKAVLEVAEFIKTFPNKNICMSGGKIKEGTDLVAVAKNIEKVAQECHELGVRLQYHNHSHEFENDAEIFKTLVKYAPSLFYALDIGWVKNAGSDPFQILTDYADRIKYVHLRDIKFDTKEFVDLGEGDFDYKKLMQTVKNAVGDGWAVVEYEHGEQDIERYTRAKKFLDSVL